MSQGGRGAPGRQGHGALKSYAPGRGFAAAAYCRAPGAAWPPGGQAQLARPEAATRPPRAATRPPHAPRPGRPVRAAVRTVTEPIGAPSCGANNSRHRPAVRTVTVRCEPSPNRSSSGSRPGRAGPCPPSGSSSGAEDARVSASGRCLRPILFSLSLSLAHRHICIFHTHIRIFICGDFSRVLSPVRPAAFARSRGEVGGQRAALRPSGRCAGRPASKGSPPPVAAAGGPR